MPFVPDHAGYRDRLEARVLDFDCLVWRKYFVPFLLFLQKSVPNIQSHAGEREKFDYILGT